RAAADGDDDLVDVEALRTLGVGVADGDGLIAHFGAGHLRAQAHIQAQLLEMPQRLLGELLVGDRQELRERFQNDDLAPEPAPDATELQADDPRSDHPQPLRYGIELERSPRIDDALAVEGGRAQLDWRRAAR